MKKILAVIICVILFLLSLVGCSIEKMSKSKYSEITEKHYEEFRGFKAAFYNKEEIIEEGLNDCIEWFNTRELNGRYYCYLYSNPFNWDLFIYYPVSKKVFESFKFCQTTNGEGFKIYVECTDISANETPFDYILILIQSPQLTSIRPVISELFVDDISIEKGEVGFFN